MPEKTMSEFERWGVIIFLAAFLGIYTAEMIVYLPDWWAEFYNFYIRGGWRP